MRTLAGSSSSARSIGKAAPRGLPVSLVCRPRHGLMLVGMPDSRSAWPLYFFLSYARADSRDGPFLEKFARDLGAEVRRRVGHPDPDTVGFFDRSSIQQGDAWSARLVAALCHCRTFVAMCSPSFFVSENCGREWGLFQTRLRSAAVLDQTCPSALLPVIWVPLRRVPKPLAQLQYDHDKLGKVYAESGLLQLMRLKRNHDEYQEFLLALAARIVQLAEDSPLVSQSETVAFNQVPNAFSMLVGPAPAPDQGNPSSADQWALRRNGKNSRQLPRLDGP